MDQTCYDKHPFVSSQSDIMLAGNDTLQLRQERAQAPFAPQASKVAFVVDVHMQ